MKCNNCGETIAEGHKFCRKCGTSIDHSVAEAKEPIVEQTVEQAKGPEPIKKSKNRPEKLAKKKGKRIFIVSGIIILTLILIIGTIAIFRRPILGKTYTIVKICVVY